MINGITAANDPYALDEVSQVGKAKSKDTSARQQAENFRAAQLTNQIVGKLFPTGAGNQKDHLFASAGESYWRAVKATQMRSGKLNGLSPDRVRREVTFKNAERAIAFKGGNCDQFANAAFAVLASLDTLLTPDSCDPEQQEIMRELGIDSLLGEGEAVPEVHGRIHLVNDLRNHHRYVVIGEDAFDRNNVVVDPWVLQPEPHLIREGAFEPGQLVATHDPRIDSPLIDVFHIRDLQRQGEEHMEVGDRDGNEQLGDRLSGTGPVKGNTMKVWNQRSSKK